MATLPVSEELWTVREYLSTTWSPDREFVDGRIEKRNFGEKEHSILQRFFTVLFFLKRAEWGVEVFPDCAPRLPPGIFAFRMYSLCAKGSPSSATSHVRR
jgi:hypothetical protein